MTDRAEISKSAPEAPSWWARLLIFVGLQISAGIVILLSSPGGTVQTTAKQLESVILIPVYAPAEVAFCFGGVLHSAILFFAALLICYPAAVVLTFYYFSAENREIWFVCAALLVLELLLAWAGQSIFISNMKGWT